VANQEQAFDLTDNHLKVLREMIFLWVIAEGGAPGMFGYSPAFHDHEDGNPYIRLLDRHRDLSRIIGLDADPTALSEAQQKELDALHESMGTALEIALETAQLAAGEHHYPNYFQQFELPGLSALMPPLFDTWERYGEYRQMPAPKADQITFQLTDDHLKLLRHIRVDWNPPEGYTGINFKRPYGDMTYFELDMAAILGIPASADEFSDDQRRIFHTLHTDMLFALPVLLRLGKISTGHYQVVDDKWSLIG
jgi:hypothetical protein